MATDFTQDTVLHFLQSSGGSVKNSDLLLHFRTFIRDHADRERNREHFKKFVNSVATVQQIDGVSYVVLRKKFRGHVPRASGTEERKQSPAGRAEKLREVTSEKTTLPAAGIIVNNNNNVETNLNLKQRQLISSSVRPAAALVSHISEKTQTQSPRLTEPPAQDQHTQIGKHREGRGPSAGITPVVPSVRHDGETCQRAPLPETLTARQARLPEPPLQPVSLHTQVAPRRVRHRQSYKSAVSCDEDEEEEEEVPVRRGSAGGAWPVSIPLGDMGRAISASSPCIIDPPEPVVQSSSSSSSERTLPKIYIQDIKGEMLPTGAPDWSLEAAVGQRGQWLGPGLESGSGEWMSTRRSLPVEAELCVPSQGQTREMKPHDVHGCVQPAGVPLEPKQRTDQSQRLGLSSSQSSIFSPSFNDVLSNSNRPPSGPGWGSFEDLQARTGDLCHDREEAESSDGSSFSSPLRQRPTVAKRFSSQLRSRMCRSLGADLDQLLQEEARGGGEGGGSEAARLNRLHLISSTLSLRYDLSSSSLSSCSTPPRCHSLADLVEGTEGNGGMRSLPTASSFPARPGGPSKQSPIPLEQREHDWMVKGAAGAWPDIYSLFREDSSLLNRRDFISGFTVLHWIAKHGDHRVLNTLWYGVQKAGVTFDINARSACGHTPLHIAAMHGHKNIMRLLVSKFSADVKLRDTAGKKAWQYLSCTVSSDVFQLLGAPPQATWRGEGGVGKGDNSWKPAQHHRRHRRHHLSSASSGQRPLTIAGTIKVKRSSSIAALLKHKSLRRFHGHQSDSSM